MPRLRPEQLGDASDLRFHTEVAFYIELEDRFFQQMRAFLRDELGVRSLLVGSSDHNHSRSGYPLLSSTAKLDVVDPAFPVVVTGRAQKSLVPDQAHRAGGGPP